MRAGDTSTRSRARGLLAGTVPVSMSAGPGPRFVVVLQGCTFDCLACDHPTTIPHRVVGGARWVEVDELVAAIRAVHPGVAGVTVAGGEATGQWSFVLELFQALRDDPELSGLTRFVHTNGDAEAGVWELLGPVMDMAVVDLKAFDPDVHRFLTGRSNERVLVTVELLARRRQLHEVRLLLLPGINDSDRELLRTADWLQRVAPGVPLRLQGFHQEGVRCLAEGFPEMTAEQLRRAAATLSLAGLVEVTTV
jgi:pyruvate-formate lyase-activating enzyme